MERHDVVVVGAGLAGLAAADRLVDAGADVLVVEARDRVGGRVHSHRFGDGQFCERGAEFVDSTHREVVALAGRLGLPLIDAGGSDDGDDGRWLDLGGRAVALSMLPSVAAEHARWDAAVSELASMVDADSDDPLGAPDAARLDRQSVDELIASLALSVPARVLVGRELRTELMLPPAEVSQLHLAWIAAGHRRAGDGREAYRVDGGADRLAAGLAAGLTDRILLGCPARSIDAGAGAVLASVDLELVADHVVVTVPPPLLARLDVDPPLPPDLVLIGMGVGGKVSTQYERRVWRDHDSDGRVLSDRAVGELWETTVGQRGDRGVLTALLSSHDGAALAALPDVGERVRKEVVRLFPGAKGLALDTVTTDWTDDPWSLGCYAAFGPGQLSSSWPLLRRPHGRILFAGEHTDAMAGYMEGALRSGHRVAAAILGGG